MALDELFTKLDVVLGCGITRLFEGYEPVVIVYGRIGMTAFVAVRHQQPGMMVDALLDSGIVAKLLVRQVIVMTTIGFTFCQPLLTALDAKVVIPLASQF